MLTHEANSLSKVELYCENGQPASADWKKPFGKLVSRTIKLNERYDIFTPNRKIEGEFGYCADMPELKKILITTDTSGISDKKIANYLEVIEPILDLVKRLYGRDMVLASRVVKIFLLKWSNGHTVELFRFNKIDATLQKIKTSLSDEVVKNPEPSDGGAFLKGMYEMLTTSGTTLDLILHFTGFGFRFPEDNAVNSELTDKMIWAKKKTIWVGFDSDAAKVKDSGVVNIDKGYNDRLILLR